MALGFKLYLLGDLCTTAVQPTLTPSARVDFKSWDIWLARAIKNSVVRLGRAQGVGQSLGHTQMVGLLACPHAATDGRSSPGAPEWLSH